jgi:hypothetical protein
METANQVPFDLSKGQPILAMRVDDHQVLATMTVGQLLALVPDPLASEDAKRVADDPTMRSYAEIRREVQRMVQVAKAKNAVEFAKYLIAGLRGDRLYMVPPITLYHPEPLEVIPLAHGQVVLMLPYGHVLTAIDGETQRIAWQIAARDYAEAMAATVKTVIHHGIGMLDARQGFYDLNTREVKPNAAVAIAMDTQDLATGITRRLMEESDVLRDGGVNLQRWQLRRSDPELMTISALRTGVVTTILGASGLQVGSPRLRCRRSSRGATTTSTTPGSPRATRRASFRRAGRRCARPRGSGAACAGPHPPSRSASRSPAGARCAPGRRRR